MRAPCDPQHRDRAHRVAVPCVPLQRGRCPLPGFPEALEEGVGKRRCPMGGEEAGSTRTDFAETKGPQRRNETPLCSPLQLEAGHSSLEEAHSHAGVLGHCLVKCLRTEMPTDHQGLQFHHPCVTDTAQIDDQWRGAKEFHWAPQQPACRASPFSFPRWHNLNQPELPRCREHSHSPVCLLQ